MSADESTPRWSITKAEWDGYQRGRPLDTLTKRVIVGAIVVLGLAFMALPILLPGDVASPGLTRLIAVVGAFAVAVTILQVTFSFWWSRQWDRLRPMIWDANGCVCPWCNVRTDTTPCKRHGFSGAEHTTMLAYWEALPAVALGDRAKALLALRAAAPRRPLVWRAIGVLQRARLRAEAVQHDPNSTLVDRLRAAVPSAVVTAVVVLCVLPVLIAFAPRTAVSGIVPVALPWLLMSPFMVAIGPLWRAGRPRCTACKHICIGSRPSVCTECGADLTRPAAVTRMERSNRAPMLLMFVPMTVLFGVMFFQDDIVGALPKPVRDAYWTNIRPPSSYWRKLTPATMTQAEVDEAARLLIECAKPGRARPLFDFAFLCDVERAGKLTPELLEGVARATVQATLAATQDGAAVVATVTPAFGELLLGSSKTPRLVFGGVSIDGAAWTEGAGWSLFAHDTDAFWRANGQLPALPESQLVFTARLDGVAPGLHTVRARCWIVIWGPQWERYAPVFDESGALVPPAGAVAYPLDLEATVDMR